MWYLKRLWFDTKCTKAKKNFFLREKNSDRFYRRFDGEAKDAIRFFYCRLPAVHGYKRAGIRPFYAQLSPAGFLLLEERSA
jgi:hypothetical protein